MENIFYLEQENEIEIFEKAYNKKIPIILKGPTGTGKTRFIDYMAKRLNTNLYSISCNEETSSTDLVGRYILKGDETIWVDGPLTKAVKEGAIIYLDEFAEARADILVAIHSITDYRRKIYIDKLGIEVKAHPNFLLIASYNPGYQSAYKEIKPSTRQRFMYIDFQYPNEKKEIEILKGETNIDEKVASKFVKLSTKIRNLYELGLTETISTRLLVNTCMLYNEGLTPRKAFTHATIEALTDDKELKNSLIDISNLYL